VAAAAVLHVGDTLVLTAPTTDARVAYSTDGSLPSCSVASDSTVRHIAVTSVATLSLKVVACQDGRWNSSARSCSWTPIRHDAVLLGTVLDTSAGTSLSWSDPISLAATNGLTISWKALVLSDTVVPDASSWSALDADGTVGVSSSIDTGSIRKLVRSRLKLSDTVGRVLAKAWVIRNNAVVDSIRFWWKVRIPAAPKPVAVVSRDSADLSFTWPVADSTKGTKVWIDTPSGAWTRVYPSTSSSGDTFAVAGLPSGKAVQIKLVGVNSATGRESDTVLSSATTLLPPTKAGFTVSNTNTKTGEVTLTLDAATIGQSATTWKVGWAASGGTIDYTSGVLDETNDTWKSRLNAATIQIGVRATRDGISKDSVITLAVQRTDGASPNPVQGLRLSHRDTSSLTWSWTTGQGRSYRVYYRSDAPFAASSDTTSRTNVTVGAVDSFHLGGLPQGKVVWVGVVALAGGDSTGGDAAPSYSNGDTTLRIPAAPIGLTLAARDTGSITWSWTGMADHTYRVFWKTDAPTASGLTDTATATGAVTLAAGTSTWTIPDLNAGTGVAMAVQTVVAPDSTGGPSALASGYGVTKQACASVASLAGTILSGTSVEFTWSAVSGASSYEYSFDEGTNVYATTGTTETYLGSSADASIQVRAVNSEGVYSEWRKKTIHVPQLKTLNTAEWNVWYAGLSGSVRYLNTVSTAQADTIRVVDSFATTATALDFRKALTVNSVQSIAVDTSKLSAYPRIYLQYRWANGDTTKLSGIAMNYAVPQTPSGIAFSVATGTSTDTLSAMGLQTSSVWSTYCKIHSLTNGWEDFAGRAVGSNLATAVYGNGTDSLKTFLVYSGSAAHVDTTAYSVPAVIDHRGTASVTYQNTSTGTIHTTRINGRTWMAENLNYNIPNDTLDLCNSESDPDCSKFGRLYSLSEALAMSGGATCDLIKDAIGNSSCTFTNQGVCPSGWHVPDSADWKSLNDMSGAVQNRFFSGTWHTSAGTDTVLVDPYGLNILPALGCDRPNHGDATCRTSLSGGAIYYSRTAYRDQAVQGAWFNYNGLNSNSGSDDVWYFNPTGSIVSYYPVRCIRDE
jgi:uncharacterized protein (TIGR02145 family)